MSSLRRSSWCALSPLLALTLSTCGDDGRSTDGVGKFSWVEISFVDTTWDFEAVRSSGVTLIVHLLSWRRYDLPSHDASQNSQRLPSSFRR